MKTVKFSCPNYYTIISHELRHYWFISQTGAQLVEQTSYATTLGGKAQRVVKRKI
jgi:hypothetical protein